MQNRVKRLLFEEERARKLESMAKNKADKMLEARLFLLLFVIAKPL
jgi:hypothetical protein